jgi:two-component system, OmpR family, response regulator
VHAWTVLLIDDQEEFVSTLVERLRLRGMEAHFATTLEQGRVLLESLFPRLVVLAVTTHEGDGLTMIVPLKKAFPSIPIIALTDLGRMKDVQDSVQMGAFRCLMKPLRIEELIEAFNEALGDS